MGFYCEHIFDYDGGDADENGWTCDLNMEHCPLIYEDWPAVCPAAKETLIIDTGGVMDGKVRYLVKAGNGELLDPEELEPLSWDKDKTETENIIEYYRQGLIDCAKDRDRLIEKLTRNAERFMKAEQENRKLEAEAGRLRLELEKGDNRQ